VCVFWQYQQANNHVCLLSASLKTANADKIVENFAAAFSLYIFHHCFNFPNNAN